jgi:hypothetical protein
MWERGILVIRALSGDCREVLATLPADCVDACVADPPYRRTAHLRPVRVPPGLFNALN